MVILYSYLAVINIVTFILYGIDKLKAMRDHYRIPEYTLLGCAGIGGSIGAIVGMYLFHHKVRKPKFKFGVPLMLAVQIAIVIFIVNRA